MTIRIVTEEEVREAFRDSRRLAAAKAHALNELAHLQEWVLWTDEKKEWAENPKYPLEMIAEIRRSIEEWPDPITPEQIGAS